MKLSDLIKGIVIKRVTGNMDTDVLSVAYDSRHVTPGTLFVAIRGFKTDGHRYIMDAVSRGASALIIEGETNGNVIPSVPIPVLTVSDSREAIARVAINYYGDPSRKLKVIGVTGTNGKTTTTYLIRAILEGAGHRTGLIGTVSYAYGDKTFPSVHTTPEAMEFQGLLREMGDNRCEFVVTEVSSHALALKRVHGTEFSTALFTNLTQDHLDFHADMENYFQAKALLFSGMTPGNRAIINSDDPYGRRLTGMTKGPVYTYGVDRESDIHAKDIRLSMDGLEFNAATPAGRIRIKSGLVGIYNVYNILGAIGAGLSCNIPLEKIAAGIASVSSIPGRFEKIDSGMGFGVVVDYAHTEDALRLLLKAAAGFVERKIITLFGCGGDRDRGKRPLMGKAAIELSDYVIVTSDNPRTENPQRIMDEIEAGVREAMRAPVRRAAGYKLILDRGTAIEEAVQMAKEGDLVVVAGKGHECYQIIGNKKLHFDDREEIKKAIVQRKGTC